MDPAFLQGEVARLEAELAGLRMAPAEPVGISQTAGVDQLMAELHSAQARARTRTQHITALTTGPGRRSVGGGGGGGVRVWWRRVAGSHRRALQRGRRREG